MLYVHFVAMGKVLMTKVQMPHKVFSIRNQQFVCSTWKCHKQTNCITNLYVGSLEIEHLYMLGNCLCTLRCASRSHKLFFAFQTLHQILTSIVAFYPHTSHYFFGNQLYQHYAHTCPCYLCYKLKVQKNPSFNLLKVDHKMGFFMLILMERCCSICRLLVIIKVLQINITMLDAYVHSLLRIKGQIRFLLIGQIFKKCKQQRYIKIIYLFSLFGNMAN